MAQRSDDRRRHFKTWRRWCALVSLLGFASGCTTQREHVAKALGTGVPAPTVREIAVAETYRLACPDVVEMIVEGRPDLSGQFPIDAEGRIRIASLENPRVEGETTPSLARKIAEELDLPAEQVRCRVSAHRCRVIHVRGSIEGGDRVVVYQGPESAVACIRRCGGLLPGANIKDIHVVRSNIPLGTKPEVYAVDLEGILLRGDPSTNVILQPFDELHIGEMARMKIGRALPEWLRPVYRGFCGLVPGFCPHDWRQQIREGRE